MRLLRALQAAVTSIAGRGVVHRIAVEARRPVLYAAHRDGPRRHAGKLA